MEKLKKLEVAGLIWKWKFYLSLVLVMTFMSCELPPEELPPATHEGRNTVGFFLGDELVGGEVDTVFWVDDQLQMTYIYRKRVGGSFSKTYYEDFNLFFQQNAESEFIYDSVCLNSNWNGDLTPNPSQINFCEITYQNTEKKIVSGLFEFNLAVMDTIWTDDTTYILNPHFNEHLTKGRFDLSY